MCLNDLAFYGKLHTAISRNVTSNNQQITCFAYLVKLNGGRQAPEVIAPRTVLNAENIFKVAKMTIFGDFARL